MRMLDNVIDINYYAVKKARTRTCAPSGGHGHHGLPGLPAHDAHAYASQDAIGVRRPLDGSRLLLRLLGIDRAGRRTRRYSSYKGSLWDRGILPIDSVELLAKERGGYLDVDRSQTLDWDGLRARIAEHGMRNNNCVAIAPHRDHLPTSSCRRIHQSRRSPTCR